MLLPLSSLQAHNACHLDDRIEAFSRHHGHLPGETSTFSEWAAVTPQESDLIWALRCVPGGKKIAVEVTWRAAMRVLPIFERACPTDQRPRKALELVRKWLDGSKVSAEDLRQAVRAAADATCADATYADAATYAADAAYYATCADAAYYAATAAADSAADAAGPKEREERELQRADILALTGAP